MLVVGQEVALQAAPPGQSLPQGDVVLAPGAGVVPDLVAQSVAGLGQVLGHTAHLVEELAGWGGEAVTLDEQVADGHKA